MYEQHCPLNVYHGHYKCVRVYLHECFSQVGSLLDQLPMLFEEGAQEQAEVLDEVLLIIFPV